MNEIYLMVVITNRGMREKFISFYKQNHITVTLATLGFGTAHSSVLDYLGLEATEKAVYFSFVTRETWKNLKKELQNKIKIDLPGRGIAFIIPLSSIGGKKALEYLTLNQNVIIEEESTLKETTYELLVTITNTGYSDTIMDAARSAYAPGGTIIHAKGTGAEEAKKYLGITLTDEKELVFIVVRTAQKNAIMKAIMDKAGLKSKAGAIVFSLPVVSTAGLRLLEEDTSE